MGTDPEQTQEENRQALRLLAETGADLSQSREIWHFLYLPNSEWADKAAQILRDDGFDVELTEAEDRDGMIASASHVALLDEEYLDRWDTTLNKLASSLGGEYEGWEADSQP